MGSGCCRAAPCGGAGPPDSPARQSERSALRAVVVAPQSRAAAQGEAGHAQAGVDDNAETPLQLSGFELRSELVFNRFRHEHVFPATRVGAQELLVVKAWRIAELLPYGLSAVLTERRMLEAVRGSSAFVAHLRHAFRTASSLFLVLDFLAGSLRDLVARRGALPEAAARFYAAEMLLGLEALHAQRVVFRDLNPASVWVDAHGHARLADLKLAQHASKEEHYKLQGKAGTRGYVAPEILAGDFYSFPADVWSLGVTLYYLLHDRLPFRCEREEAIDPEHMAFELRADLSPALQRLLRALIAYDYKERPTVLQARRHDWFAGLDWDAVRRQAMAPPFTAADVAEPVDLARRVAFIDGKEPRLTEEQAVSLEGWDFAAGTRPTGGPAPAPAPAPAAAAAGPAQPATWTDEPPVLGVRALARVPAAQALAPPQAPSQAPQPFMLRSESSAFRAVVAAAAVARASVEFGDSAPPNSIHAQQQIELRQRHLEAGAPQPAAAAGSPSSPRWPGSRRRSNSR